MSDDPRNYGGSSVVENKPKVNVDNSVINFAKIFGFMFIGLLITTAIAFLGGYLFTKYLSNNYNAQLGILIGAGIAQIILSIVVSVVFAKGKHSVIIPGILYCICVGFLCSALTAYIDWRILGMAFGITCLMFGIMTLIAVFTKGEMKVMPVIIISLLVGLGILSLINLFLIPTIARTSSVPYYIYWIVDFGIFALLMLVTIYDVHNIKRIAGNYQADNNLMLYCAFIMYTDFIAIFIKIVYYLAIIFGRNR